MLALLTQPLCRWLRKRLRLPASGAAVLATLLVYAVLFGLLALLGAAVFREGQKLVGWIGELSPESIDQLLAPLYAALERAGAFWQTVSPGFAEQVQQVPGVCCYHCPSCQAGVVAITGPIPSEELAGRLGAEGICTRAGLHCSPLAHRSAGTLPDGAVRFSFSWFNTRQEAEAAALTVKKVLKNAEA